VLGSKSNLIVIPAALKRTVDNGATIFQLESISQFKGSSLGRDFSCGLWSVFNARALDELIIDPEVLVAQDLRGITLSSTGIAEKACVYGPKIDEYYNSLGRVEFLEPSTVVTLALNDWNRGWNLYNRIVDGNRKRNFYVLTTYAQVDNEGVVVGRSIWRYDKRHDMYKKFINTTKAGLLARFGNGAEARWTQTMLDNICARTEQEESTRFSQATDTKLRGMSDNFIAHYATHNISGVLHFACVLTNPNPIGSSLEAGHWILISIVKLKDKNPIIIVLDPRNCPLNQQGQEYVLYLYNLFISPVIR
jgi:hypothetical protein